jgi:hypothetical protein
MRYHEIITEARPKIPYNGLQRCTAVSVNAILQHFGFPPISIEEVGWEGVSVESALIKRGLSIRPINQTIHTLGTRYTVKTFVASHNVGVFSLWTTGHAMALVNGQLYDTAERGADGRRLQGVFEIYKP